MICKCPTRSEEHLIYMEKRMDEGDRTHKEYAAQVRKAIAGYRSDLKYAIEYQYHDSRCSYSRDECRLIITGT